ncbi:MAG: hypothetical protein PHW69_08815 [Elusimicrobiaceae bacterium]|nr:hypothetical protein [Elusimicrobiaceae bacterium]
MKGGDIVNTQITITNKGLIAAKEVQMSAGDSSSPVKLAFGVNNIAEIKPGETITVPLRITLVHASCNTQAVNTYYCYDCATGKTTPVNTDNAVNMNAGDMGECGFSGNTPVTVSSTTTGGGSDSGYIKTGYGVTSGNSTVNGVLVGPTSVCTAQCEVCHEWNYLSQSCIAISANKACSSEHGICEATYCNDGNCAIRPLTSLEKDAVNANTNPLFCRPRYNKIPPSHNGCSGVPDSWNIDGCGVVNVVGACNAHDECYSSCGSFKSTCDAQFESNLDNICKAKFTSSECYRKCINISGAYFDGVGMFGAYYYTKAQIDHCVCCQ